jgi:hypothetical protein
LPGRQSVHAIAANAQAIVQPLYDSAYDDWLDYDLLTTNIPPQQVTILGQQEAAYGSFVGVLTSLPDADFFDVTPKVPSVPYYITTPTDTKYLRIYFNGTDVTDTNTTVIVGQQITLTCTNAPGTPALSNFSWSVPGYAISNYDVVNGLLYTNFPLTNSTVTFYWVDGGSAHVTTTASVTCSPMCGGLPSASITTATTSVTVDTNLHRLRFAVGTNNGITFSNTISGVPTNFASSLVWAQVVTSSTRNVTESNGTVHVLMHTNSLGTNCPPPYLDALPYTAYVGNSPVDSPSMALLGPPYVGVAAYDQFEMWMMFQPSGGICVPLRAVNWFWSGSATNSGGGWTFQSSPTNSVNPTDYPTTVFPSWNCPFKNYLYVPHL